VATLSRVLQSPGQRHAEERVWSAPCCAHYESRAVSRRDRVRCEVRGHTARRVCARVWPAVHRDSGTVCRQVRQGAGTPTRPSSERLSSGAQQVRVASDAPRECSQTACSAPAWPSTHSPLALDAMRRVLNLPRGGLQPAAGPAARSTGSQRASGSSGRSVAAPASASGGCPFTSAAASTLQHAAPADKPDSSATAMADAAAASGAPSNAAIVQGGKTAKPGRAALPVRVDDHWYDLSAWRAAHPGVYAAPAVCRVRGRCSKHTRRDVGFAPQQARSLILGHAKHCPRLLCSTPALHKP
jgi:hypothetical protein